MYYGGYGVNQSYSDALKWWQKAANLKNSAGQFNLGIMYENGYGIDKNINEAIRLYRLSAAQGLQYAKDALKRLGY